MAKARYANEFQARTARDNLDNVRITGTSVRVELLESEEDSGCKYVDISVGGEEVDRECVAAEGRDFHGLCLVRLVERKAPAMSISDNATDSAYVWASKHEDYIHPSHCMFIDHVVTADEVQEWLEEVPALAPLETDSLWRRRRWCCVECSEG